MAPFLLTVSVVLAIAEMGAAIVLARYAWRSKPHLLGVTAIPRKRPRLKGAVLRVPLMYARVLVLFGLGLSALILSVRPGLLVLPVAASVARDLALAGGLLLGTDAGVRLAFQRFPLLDRSERLRRGVGFLLPFLGGLVACMGVALVVGIGVSVALFHALLLAAGMAWIGAVCVDWYFYLVRVRAADAELGVEGGGRRRGRGGSKARETLTLRSVSERMGGSLPVRLGRLRPLPSPQSLVDLMDSALQLLEEAFEFRHGELFALDRFSRLVIRTGPSVGESRLPARTSVALFGILRRARAGTSPLVLGEGVDLFATVERVGRFGSRPRRRQRPRIVAHVLDDLSKEGFRILVPLRSDGGLFGYILLGERTDQPQYTYELLDFLNDAGVYIAALLRQYVFAEEVRESRTRTARISNFFSQHGEQVNVRTIADRNLLFASDVMRELVERARTVAAGRQPVLITGETGTGKELIARLLHDEERYRKEPFVALNVAAVPAALLEDELFGHIRGAFTDARNDRDGRVAEAGQGILFLDEVGDMPLDVQVKLLRLLQERTYTRIGDNRPLKAECRFIFATHRDLSDLVREGRFREDLFYRIHVFSLHLPPLRERREDIVPLVQHFLKKYASEMLREIADIEPDALDALARYEWPGNIRELESVILRALAGAEGDRLTLSDLPLSIREARSPFPVVLTETRQRHGQPLLNAGPFDDQVKAFSRALVTQALQESKGNRTLAAELLGIKRGRLLYQLRELGIR